jgi:hypothetical protein
MAQPTSKSPATISAIHAMAFLQATIAHYRLARDRPVIQ